MEKIDRKGKGIEQRENNEKLKIMVSPNIKGNSSRVKNYFVLFMNLIKIGCSHQKKKVKKYKKVKKN